MPGMIRFQFKSPPPKILGRRVMPGQFIGRGITLRDHLCAGLADIMRVAGRKWYIFIVWQLQ